MDGGHYDFDFHKRRISWLHKLSLGELGFQNLQVLRLLFNIGVVKLWSNFWCCMELFLQRMDGSDSETESTSVVIFRVPLVDIVVCGHDCAITECCIHVRRGTPSECMCGDSPCFWVRKLRHFSCPRNALI